jgi:type IV conjugative transfer system protein TraL
MSAYSSKFPQYMSSPIEVLWWEVDQVAIAVVSFTGTLLMKGGIVMWVGVLLINYFYNAAKRGKPRGFIKHIIYMFGFAKLENYPDYFEQKFHE